MSVRSSLLALVFAATALAPSIALADMPPEPCDGADPGDACETSSGDAGTCQAGSGGFLSCVAGSGTTAASSTAATTAAASTAATTTASGAGGGGGGDGSGGSVGGGETDDGCAVRAPSKDRVTHFGAAAVFTLATAIAIARRRRRAG